jgi:hypothetical protein
VVAGRPAAGRAAGCLPVGAKAAAAAERRLAAARRRLVAGQRGPFSCARERGAAPLIPRCAAGGGGALRGLSEGLS